MKIKTRKLNVRKDDRGLTFEILKRSEIKEDIKYVYMIVSKAGTFRGNHYHKKKAEWLCVISGRAEFIFVDNKTGEKREFKVSGDKPLLVSIPVNVTHTVKNIGREPICILEITNMEYSSKNPDNFRL